MKVICGTHIELGTVVNVKTFGEGNLITDEFEPAAEDAVLPRPLEGNIIGADVKVGAQG